MPHSGRKVGCMDSKIRSIGKVLVPCLGIIVAIGIVANSPAVAGIAMVAMSITFLFTVFAYLG